MTSGCPRVGIGASARRLRPFLLVPTLGTEGLSRRRNLPRILSVLAAAAALSGCSMSAEWFIQKSLRDAGFGRAEARCAVEGVAGQLSRDQLWALRKPLVGYVMLDDPPARMDIEQFLEWLGSEVSPEIHHVVAHYATHCSSHT